MANLSRRALKSTTLLAGIAAFSLAGCAPDLGPKPEMAPPAAFESTKSMTAPDAAWPEDAWWKTYSDPQLDRLIGDALKDSPDLKMAAARVRAAEAMADINESLLWPTIVGNGTFMETEITQNIGFPAMFKPYLPKGFHNLAALSLGMQYQLDLFGKNHANFAAAMSTADAAKADEASAKLQIATGMATYYAVLTQLFAYEVPMMLAVIGPAVLAGTLSVAGIAAFYTAHPALLLVNLPGMIIALIALQGKLERVPFDIPHAKNEIVGGQFTEYSGRLLGFFLLRNGWTLTGAALALGFVLFGLIWLNDRRRAAALRIRG